VVAGCSVVVFTFPPTVRDTIFVVNLQAIDYADYMWCAEAKLGDAVYMFGFIRVATEIDSRRVTFSDLVHEGFLAIQSYDGATKRTSLLSRSGLSIRIHDQRVEVRLTNRRWVEKFWEERPESVRLIWTMTPISDSRRVNVVYDCSR
jgi:hypothetical protein